MKKTVSNHLEHCNLKMDYCLHMLIGTAYFYTPRKHNLGGIYESVCLSVCLFVRPSVRAIKKDLRGKYMVCPRHMSYFEIMR